MASPAPGPLARALTLLRTAKGWSQKDLATAAGIAPNLLSDYEGGRKTLKPERAEILVAALGLEIGAIDRALGFIAEITETVGLDHTALEGEAAAGTPPAGRRPWIEVSRSPEGERQEAQRVWETLEPLTANERRQHVEKHRSAQSWALCELVSDLSRKTVVESPTGSFELAGLAVRIAEISSGEESWRSHLMGYAWAHIANSRRVANDFSAGEQAMGHAQRLWSRTDDRGPLDRYRIWSLESSLLKDLGRTAEAIEVLDRLLAASEGQAAISLLLSKGSALTLHGESGKAIHLLRGALGRSDARSDLRMFACVQVGLVYALCCAGHYRWAARSLPAAREAMLRHGGEIDCLRLDTVEAHIATGLGRSEGFAGLLEARTGFLARGMSCDAAAVSLSLATELWKRARIAEARAAARLAVEIFEDRSVAHQEERAQRVLRQVSVPAGRRLPRAVPRADLYGPREAGA